MQLLVQSAMIFFATLAAAGLVALGDLPGPGTSALAPAPPVIESAQRLLASAWSLVPNAAAAPRSGH